MRKNISNIYLSLVALIVIVAGCEKEKNYDPARPSTPTGLTVTKADTSVFLNWKSVGDADSYVVVRGLDVIADSLTTTSYVDEFGPDTLVEYRVYAVNKEGWRSYRYASDSGYVAIPVGILPRPPVITASDGDTYKNCAITWVGGRFAKSFNLYRGDKLIAENIVGNSYTDKDAPLTPVEYKIYSVNGNGISINYSSDMGNKAYFFIDTYEDDEASTVISPWTFRGNTSGYGIAYYTEGSPVIASGVGYNGSSKSLKVLDGKVQLLCDWGGVPVKGNYKISVQVKKSTGGFWMVPNFTSALRVEASGDWTTYRVETGVIAATTTFNLKIEPDKDGDSAYIDNWSIEYIAP
jgi:hypothetical protein